MKALMMIAICISALMVAGCVSCRQPRSAYGTSFQNIGTKKISVPAFKLYASRKFSEAVCGDLWPGQGKWSGTYYEIPNRQIVFVWKLSDTGETTNQTVDLELPEQFNKYRSSIVFYIDPDNKRAYVAYELHDDAKNIHKVVDSKGNPFDISRVKGAH